MFVIRSQYQESRQQIPTHSELVSLEHQGNLLDNNFLLLSYAITWLGLTLPQFTTYEYALAPVQLPAIVNATDQGFGGGKKTSEAGNSLSPPGSFITTQTRRYWTELECWSPSAIMLNSTTNSVAFDSGRGCVATDLLSFNKSITDLYDPLDAVWEAYSYGPGTEGYDPYIPWFRLQCPDSPHLYLRTFRRAGPSFPNFALGGNATAMFCEAFYYTEPVEATLDATNFSVIKFSAIGQKEVLPDAAFNLTRFEYVIGFGIPPAVETRPDGVLIADINSVSAPVPIQQIRNMSVAMPDQSSWDLTIEYALGLSQGPLDQFLDFDFLSKAYTKAHQLLFAQAISRCFDEPSGLTEPELPRIPIRDTQQASITLLTTTLQILPAFAFAAEAILVIAVVICLGLTLSLPRRPLFVRENPDCLAEAMQASGSKDVQDTFTNLNQASEDVLRGKITKHRFILNESTGSLELQEPHLTDSDDGSAATQKSYSTVPNSAYQYPIELSLWVSVPVSMVLFTAISCLIFLYDKAQKENGLQPPSSSEIFNQFLLNFLPVAAVTLLGMYSALICRIYSFLRPIYDLSLCGATATTTLLAKHNTFLPQLLSISALRTKHYLLALMSATALASSFLTVTVAGIFIVGQIDSQNSISLELDPRTDFADLNSTLLQAFQTKPNGNDPEPWTLNYANFTTGMPLATWTTPEFAMAPLSLPQVSQASEYLLNTTLYTSGLTCLDFFQPGSQIETSLDFENNGTNFILWANFTHNDNTNSSCGIRAIAPYTGLHGQLSASSVSALEVTANLARLNESGSFTDDFCSSKVVNGWFRGKLVGDEKDFRVEYNATIALCEQQLQMQYAQVQASPQGDILGVDLLGEPQPVLNTSESLQISFDRSALNVMRNTLMSAWHNDTVARDWSNRLYIELRGNRDWLDASIPPPAYNSAIPLISKVSKRVFTSVVSLNRARMNMTATSESKFATLASGTSSRTLVDAQAVVPERRIFMSKPNFIISITILIFDFLVLMSFRISLPKPFLPRMPFTIASQIAFFAGSHIIEDVVKNGLDLQDFRYGYGKFIGRNGTVHVGIERDSFVQPLQSFGKRRTFQL